MQQQQLPRHINRLSRHSKRKMTLHPQTTSGVCGAAAAAAARATLMVCRATDVTDVTNGYDEWIILQLLLQDSRTRSGGGAAAARHCCL